MMMSLTLQFDHVDPSWPNGYVRYVLSHTTHVLMKLVEWPKKDGGYDSGQ